MCKVLERFEAIMKLLEILFSSVLVCSSLFFASFQLFDLFSPHKTFSFLLSQPKKKFFVYSSRIWWFYDVSGLLHLDQLGFSFVCPFRIEVFPPSQLLQLEIAGFSSSNRLLERKTGSVLNSFFVSTTFFNCFLFSFDKTRCRWVEEKWDMSTYEHWDSRSRGDDDGEDEKSKNKLQIKDANCRSRLMASIRAALCSFADKLLFPCLLFLYFVQVVSFGARRKTRISWTSTTIDIKLLSLLREALFFHSTAATSFFRRRFFCSWLLFCLLWMCR